MHHARTLQSTAGHRPSVVHHSEHNLTRCHFIMTGGIKHNKNQDSSIVALQHLATVT